MNMKKYLLLAILILSISWKNTNTGNIITVKQSYDSVKDFREFKISDSKYLDNNDLWAPFNADLKDFSEEIYNNLKPLILEQDIPTIQKNISSGKLTYEKLVMFYLYRIRKFDRENNLSLNSVISLNPDIVKQARQKDHQAKPSNRFTIFGMPILLKDNINTIGMNTTAGAVALQNNKTDNDAFIVKQLKSKGALILGKANLSEWAYFFCKDCPSGYSAIGGQTFNPYGRRTIDTGGSSSGSGVSVAANFCVAALGTETAGSILSPSSQNSVVGLKPTVGLLSRTGIVPISSTLDTPGPISKNVIDNAIMLDALFGYDRDDNSSVKNESVSYANDLTSFSLKGKRFGAFKSLMKDSLYVQAISNLKNEGVEIIEINAPDIKLPKFTRLLNLDMTTDLKVYLQKYANNKLITVKSVNDVINFNKYDSLKRAPYGQELFKGIVADEINLKDLQNIKDTLSINGKQFFDLPMKENNLDGILSINNFHAAYAAVAKYPALTVPMGYQKDGKPRGLTFIAKPFQEKALFQWAYVYEKSSKKRQLPKNYN